jgi:hypothetical protein
MDSIQPPKRPDRVLESIARAVAFKSRLLWRVEELREEAAKAYDRPEPPSASLGLPREQVSKWKLRQIYERVEEAAGRMDTLPPDQSEPTPSHIEAALGAFSTEQWIVLINGLDQTGTRALLAHIRKDADGKGERIVGRVIMRDTAFWLAQNRSKLVPISDPYWAAFWREQARQANREGRGLPASERSVIEQASDRSVAERLFKVDGQSGREMKVSPYEIRKWRERMEKLSFEAFAAEVGADDEEERAAAFVAWLSMIRRRHQRKRS